MPKELELISLVFGGVNAVRRRQANQEGSDGYIYLCRQIKGIIQQVK